MTDHHETRRAVDVLTRLLTDHGLADGASPQAVAAEFVHAMRGHGWRHMAELSTVPPDMRTLPTEPTDDYRATKAALTRRETT